ncbi:MAG TPA: amidohydrolase family protein [Stellaceae bacterium]
MAADGQFDSYCLNPTRPTFVPPPGAVDAHCHVFGPAAKFPFAPERKYTPYDAPKEKLFALRDFLGFQRNVIVQASCHGTDNTATIDALDGAKGMARGIAVVKAGISDGELRDMDAVGMRGVRFNFLPRLVDATDPAVHLGLARRVAALGWHVVVYFEAPSLAKMIPFLQALPTIVVLDHMSLPDAAKGVDHPDFQAYMRMLDDNPTLWVKVTGPERISRQGPPYDDFVPLAKALVERFTDRVLWGTDWPHPNMTSHMPDDGVLVDMIPRIAPGAAQRQALLVDNPMRLYWEK